jgi:PadR family transcriptional regulator PadR
MSERPRITLNMLRVLTVLLDRPLQEHYGLEMSRQAGLPTGTIYPMLARLEQAGWVTSDWEDIDEATEGRPARRYYQLTPAGAQRARQAVHDAQAMLQPDAGRRPSGTPGLPRPGEAPA